MTRFAISLLAALLLAACPQTGGTGGPVDTCKEIGQQCRMGAGQLGVCSANAEGELECVSQH